MLDVASLLSRNYNRAYIRPNIIIDLRLCTNFLRRQRTVVIDPLTTDISSDFMQSKVGWGVPLTLYLVCHRQSTKWFTSQWSFQQIKKVILHASWMSRYIYPGLQCECCCCYRQLIILEEQSSSDDTCSHGEGIRSTSDDFS